MFYSQFLLSKKGPLGVIWIAAHLDRKLRKKQIADTNIGDSVDSILYSEVPIALRISSHLLLGVVRIYARQVDYLFHDCSEALTQIRQAFQVSSINLPPKALVAPYHTITLPESFDFNDLGVYANLDDAARVGTWSEFEHHVTDRDLITLQEPMEVPGPSQSLFTLDGGFSEGPNPYNISSLSTEEEVPSETVLPKSVPITAASGEEQEKAVEEDVLPPLPMEEYMDVEDLDYGMEMSLDAEKRLENESVQDPHPEKVLDVEGIKTRKTSTQVTGQDVMVEIEQTSMHKEGLMPMDIDNDPVLLPDKEIGAEGKRKKEEKISHVCPPNASSPRSPMVGSKEDVLQNILGACSAKPMAEPAPVPRKQRKRKRNSVFDSLAVITSFNMKKQLGTSSDICRLRKKAPSTEYEIWMSQRDTTGDQKFAGPSLPGMCPELKKFSSFILNAEFQVPDKDVEARQDKTVPELDSVQEVISRARKEGNDVDSDLEESPHENYDRVIENEVVLTKKGKVETEIPSTPPRSPLSEEVSAQNVEVVTSARRRLVFEAPSTSQQGLQPSMDAEIDAQQIQDPSPSCLHIEETAKLVPEVHGEPILEVGSSNVIAEDISRQQREVSPSAFQASENLSDQLVSQGLEFLAESQEPDVGNGIANGSVEVNGSIDTELEHFGKFMQDKSGWAFRTRGVAEYLRGKFADVQMQGTDEQPRLSLCNLSKRMCRREAARMFFETVVLRSKDYIQVQQQKPFADIYLQPTEQLMRADL